VTKSWFVLALVAGAAAAHAGDAFDGLTCDADVAKALIGKHLANGPVEATEKRHAALGLKHEGSEELSASLDYEAWTICGGTYHLIVRKDVVADVIRADHSSAAPAFLGTCDETGAAAKGEVLAILTPGDVKAEKWAAMSAWRIDETHARFVATSADKLMCQRSGIGTSDGGS
jgi:hypothetical protein